MPVLAILKPEDVQTNARTLTLDDSNSISGISKAQDMADKVEEVLRVKVR